MSDQAMKSFLNQFAISKQRVNEWPPYLRDSARMATASFPKPTHSTNRKDTKVAIASSKKD